MRISMSTVLLSIFATAQAASLAARHEGHSHSEPNEMDHGDMDHGGMNFSGCQEQCHALYMMAEQCVDSENSMVTCPCTPELTEAMQTCNTCVEAEGDSLDGADLEQFQSSLTNYKAQCSANGTASASPSAQSIAATLFASEFAAAETASPAAETDSDSSAIPKKWSGFVAGAIGMVVWVLV